MAQEMMKIGLCRFILSGIFAFWGYFCGKRFINIRRSVVVILSLLTVPPSQVRHSLKVPKEVLL